MLVAKSRAQSCCRDTVGVNEGSWVQPAIWTGLSGDAAVVREGIFGLCCHVEPGGVSCRGGSRVANWLSIMLAGMKKKYRVSPAAMVWCSNWRGGCFPEIAVACGTALS